jgi:cyclopropane-fatty-acyl-phospholipid synthase
MELLFRLFASSVINHGSMEIELPSGRLLTLGDGSPAAIRIRINDKAALIALMRDPTLSFGELFMEGRFEVTRGSIYDVLALIAENSGRANPSIWVRALARARLVLSRFQLQNDAIRSRRNVAHHYDLDSRLYALFLDPDRQYSCAYFERPGESLEAAQLAKKRHIAAKLCLEPGQKVLDIGCGWGGMALYLARVCGVQVRGITLSQEQLAIARERATADGLAAAAAFELRDYRAVEERFDRIVSVGMFEHVGVSSYDTYFQKIAALLEDDGVGLVHTIGRVFGPSATNPWVAKYIFPGGYIPSLSEIMPAIERAGLYVTDIEILRLHYAETLKAWRERFLARRTEAAALYDERFCRMWEFYLAGSECSFRYEGNVIFQIQLAKQVGAVPMTRDYMSRREAELRRKDSAFPALRIAGE